MLLGGRKNREQKGVRQPFDRLSNRSIKHLIEQHIIPGDSGNDDINSLNISWRGGNNDREKERRNF
jgi:hypothetical protein